MNIIQISLFYKCKFSLANIFEHFGPKKSLVCYSRHSVFHVLRMNSEKISGS